MSDWNKRTKLVHGGTRRSQYNEVSEAIFLTQGFVYDNQLRLSATLDENNYATYYDYDGENTLFLVRKETERGIRTIQQTSSNQKGSE